MSWHHELHGATNILGGGGGGGGGAEYLATVLPITRKSIYLERRAWLWDMAHGIKSFYVLRQCQCELGTSKRAHHLYERSKRIPEIKINV